MHQEPFPPDTSHDYLTAQRETARNRLSAPAILLIVVGVLNVAAALGLTLAGGFYRTLPPDKFETLMREHDPRGMNELERQGWTAQTLLNTCISFFFGSGVVTGLVGLLIVLGAVRMSVAHSYGLAVLASVLAMTPCVSPSCCGVIGLLAGVWSLIVLLDADVREAFL